MRYTFADYQQAADVVAARLDGFRPEIAMILGSGLGDMADMAENPIVIPYGEIPGFSVSTAPGHRGQLVFGTLMGKNVAVMQGRLHAYEGYTFEEVCFPLRVLRLLGCDKLVITNACGGVNLRLQVGDICLITDHIKFFMDSPCGVRISPSSAPASPTPPISTPPGCRTWPVRPPESRDSSWQRACICTSPAPPMRLPRKSGPSGCWAAIWWV